MTAEQQAAQVLELTNRISPILHGLGPDIQSAVLGDLVSMWVAGHFADGPEATAKLRTEVMHDFVRLVFDLVPSNEAVILEHARRSAS